MLIEKSPLELEKFDSFKKRFANMKGKRENMVSNCALQIWSCYGLAGCESFYGMPSSFAAWKPSLSLSLCFECLARKDSCGLAFVEWEKSLKWNLSWDHGLHCQAIIRLSYMVFGTG